MLSKFPSNIEPIRVMHSGQLGDIIYCLPVLRELAKDRPVIFFVRCNMYVPHCQAGLIDYSINRPLSQRRERCINRRCSNLLCYNPITRLLLEQPYIADVQTYGSCKKKVDYYLDLDTYRRYKYPDCHNIQENMKQNKVKLDNWQYPWLHITETKRPCKEPFVIISRTDRFYNPNVNLWKNALKLVAEKYNDNFFFIGDKIYYEYFRKTIKEVEYLETFDVLEMAQYIKEADYVVTNQTNTLAVVQGLGKRYMLDSHKPTEHVVRFYNFNETLLEDSVLNFRFPWDIEI